MESNAQNDIQLDLVSPLHQIEEEEEEIEESPNTALLSQDVVNNEQDRRETEEVRVQLDVVNERDSREVDVVRNNVTLWSQMSGGFTTSRLWKRANYAICLYFLPMTIALGTVLLVDWDKECNLPLKLWAMIQFVIQSLVIIMNIIIINKLPQNQMEINVRMSRSHRVYYIINRILLLLTFIWFVVGAYFTFSSSNCPKSVPFLYKITHSIMISQIVNLVLVCIFVVIYSVLKYCGFNTASMLVIPERALSDQNPKALPVESINSLEMKEFSEGLGIAKEDASCAICLCAYENDEEIRFLPCQKAHHFHRKCIDQWLFSYDKCCPMCKKEIEPQV